MNKNSRLEKILNMLGALDDADVALLPSEPSENMCRAAADSTGVSEDEAKEIYINMVECALADKTDIATTIH